VEAVMKTDKDETASQEDVLAPGAAKPFLSS
jgi:hypothetical protein